jgi:uncharacterized SAM-binding protein YcdF (DUF218 family)
MHRMRNSAARRLILGFAAGSLLGLWTFREQFLITLSRFVVCSDPPQKADLIYVLAGDFWGSRVLLGAELGARGYAQRVIYSGGAYQNSFQGDLAIRFAVQHGYSRRLFQSVRTTARSTIEEARELRPVFERLGAKRVLLVTAAHHSRRTDLAFRLFLPGIQFFTVAAPDRDFEVASWWKTEPGRRVFFSECWKIIATLMIRAKSGFAGAAIVGLLRGALELPALQKFSESRAPGNQLDSAASPK